MNTLTIFFSTFHTEIDNNGNNNFFIVLLFFVPFLYSKTINIVIIASVPVAQWINALVSIQKSWVQDTLFR